MKLLWKTLGTEPWGLGAQLHREGAVCQAWGVSPAPSPPPAPSSLSFPTPLPSVPIAKTRSGDRGQAGGGACDQDSGSQHPVGNE